MSAHRRCGASLRCPSSPPATPPTPADHPAARNTASAHNAAPARATAGALGVRSKLPARRVATLAAAFFGCGGGAAEPSQGREELIRWFASRLSVAVQPGHDGSVGVQTRPKWPQMHGLPALSAEICRSAEAKRRGVKRRPPRQICRHSGRSRTHQNHSRFFQVLFAPQAAVLLTIAAGRPHAVDKKRGSLGPGACQSVGRRSARAVTQTT